MRHLLLPTPLLRLGRFQVTTNRRRFTIVSMIKRFRHKGLERLFTKGDASGVNPQFVAKLRRMLALLNESAEPGGMNLPNYRLHPLKGDRKGQWAVWVSGNWRLIFAFDGEDASDVDLDDYH